MTPWEDISTFKYEPGTAPPKVQIYQPDTGVETAQYVPSRSSRSPAWWATVPGRWQRQPTHWREIDLPDAPASGKDEPLGSDAELYRYMLSVAEANGFDSLTDAITRAVCAETRLSGMVEAVKALKEMVRLSEMGFEESMAQPEENGNFAAFERAKAALSVLAGVSGSSVAESGSSRAAPVKSDGLRKSEGES